MKKNILASLLLATCFLEGNAYVLVKKYRYFGPEVAQYIDLGRITATTWTNLSGFKEIEKKAANNGVSIFKLRVNGFSVLQLALLNHMEWNPEYRKKTEEVLDYMLSKIPAECLNECVEGSYSSDIFYGTAVAVAALRSPLYLTKILGHPKFDATNFLMAHPCGRPECEMTAECMSLTPRRCVKLLSSKSSGYDDAAVLIHILEQAFPNDVKQQD